MQIHFKPADGHVGDVVPFYWEGVYHAFYLKRREGRGTCYAHAVSHNLVSWEELPDALETGQPGDVDYGNCFTGSFIERQGTFHLFYTGHTPDNPPWPVESICHAVSQDLVSWTKDPANPILLAEERWYERDDWRDPYVFWNQEEACYWMLLTARGKEAKSPRRGCIAVAKSTDLQVWEVHPPVWEPHIVYAPECPDVFQASGRWFALFSNVETRYRSFARWGESWTAPPVTDALDGAYFYAAKAFHNGDRHLLAGWISSNAGEKDSGKREWGGTMGMLRELRATPDGRLHVACPEEVRRLFQKTALGSESLASAQPLTGEWEHTGNALRGSCLDGMGMLLLPGVPADYRLTLTLTLHGPAATGGVLLRLPDTLVGGYQFALEPARRRALVRAWESWGDGTPRVERALSVETGRPVTLEVYAMGNILEIFVDDMAVLSARLYDFAEGNLGLFVVNGVIEIEDFQIHVTTETETASS